MIRVAAVGDVHYDRHPRKEMRTHFAALSRRADLFLIAGDLTQAGTVEEAVALAEDLEGVGVPMVAVLGNHDFHSEQQDEIIGVLAEAGVRVLEGGSVSFEIRGHTVGIAGIKGFGGGFWGGCVTDFGEPEIKRFARHAHEQARFLRENLGALETDFRFALTHFSPIDGTLLGEKRELYPFLGSYLLAEAIDDCGADAAFHGHAHHGVERGITPGGVPVRNVALNVIRHAYNIYSFDSPARSRGLPSEGESPRSERPAMRP